MGARIRARKNIFGQHKIISAPYPPNLFTQSSQLTPQKHSSTKNQTSTNQQRNIQQQRNNLQQTNEFINNEKLHHEVKSNNEGVKGNNKDYSQQKRQRGTHHIAEHKKTIRLGKLPHYEGNLQGNYPRYLSKMLTLASSRRRRKARSLI